MTKKTSTLDIRCSAACTRAGLTALLLSALAISMLYPLKDIKPFNALAEYAMLRFQLNHSIDQLDMDPCWKELTGSEIGNKASTEWNLFKLMEYKCGSLEESEPKLTKPPPSQSLKEMENNKPISTSEDHTPPPAPTQLRISYSLWQVQEIADILTDLGDGKLLARARSFSPLFDLSVYRWEFRRRNLMHENERAKGMVIITGPPSRKSKQPAPSIPRDDLLKFLTLENIRELAEYEFPDLSKIENIAKELGRVALPWITIPFRFKIAIIFVELGLLLSLGYFWLFQSEACSSGSFPAPGTLFGVFGRTTTSRVMFKIFAFLPAIAAALLAIYSDIYFNGPLAVFVFLFSLKIARKGP